MSVSRLLAMVVASLLAPCATVMGQTPPQVFLTGADQARLNDNVVGIVTGGPGGKYLPFAADMARVLDERSTRGSRLVVSVGYGSVQNIDDLLNLRGIDLAIVQADVLDVFRRDPQTYQQLRAKMRYVTRLYREEIHVLARGKLAGIAALDHKRVSIGQPGSGTQITAHALFNRFGIQPVEEETSDKEARDRLIAGDIDAMIYVVGRGASTFKDINGTQSLQADLNFVPFGPDAGDMAPYESSTLTSADYPALIQPGVTIPVGTVPSVLAVFAWDAKQPRYRPVRQFVERLFSRVGDIARRPGIERTLWCQVDLSTPLAGWERFSVAADWLARNRGSRPTQGCDANTNRDRECFDKFQHDTRSKVRIDDFNTPEAADLYSGWRKRGHGDCPENLGQ